MKCAFIFHSVELTNRIQSNRIDITWNKYKENKNEKIKKNIRKNRMNERKREIKRPHDNIDDNELCVCAWIYMYTFVWAVECRLI